MSNTNVLPCKCEDPLLNIKALADYLHISVSAATKLSAKRVIPALKPSKKIVLYRQSDVDFCLLHPAYALMPWLLPGSWWC